MQALRVARGERPYLDFATGYGPLYFAIQGALVGLGGLPAVRWALVGVHGVAAAALFAATRRLVGGAGAALAVLVTVAFFLPVAPRQGAPLLIPYPSWWVEATALACLLLVDRRHGLPGVGRAGLAGAAAGMAFAMKPNSGLLLAAGCMAALVLGARPGAAYEAPEGDRPARAAGPLGTALLLLLAAGALALVMPPATTVLWWSLVPPALVLAALGRRDAVADSAVAPRAAALAGAFFAVAGPAYAPALLALGPAAFLRDALLVGAGVADVYASTFPVAALAAAAAGVLAFADRPRAALALGVTAVATAAAAAVAGAPGGVAAVRLAAERGLAAAVPLVLWGGLAAFRTRRDARLAAPLALAVLSGLQLYPRPDFLHLVSVAPVLLPLAAVLARDAAAAWGGTRAVRAVGAVAAAVALARLAPALGTATAIVGGHVETVRAGAVAFEVEPAGGPRLRALGAAVDAVATRTGPGARVATFPGCALVPFLAGRLGAGPHDYFFPGRPSRAEGAALAEAWRAAPPPVAVTCDAAGTDLAAAWAAYPELVALFAERYRPVHEGPPFTVSEARP